MWLHPHRDAERLLYVQALHYFYSKNFGLCVCVCVFLSVCGQLLKMQAELHSSCTCAAHTYTHTHSCSCSCRLSALWAAGGLFLGFSNAHFCISAQKESTAVLERERLHSKMSYQSTHTHVRGCVCASEYDIFAKKVQQVLWFKFLFRLPKMQLVGVNTHCLCVCVGVCVADWAQQNYKFFSYRHIFNFNCQCTELDVRVKILKEIRAENWKSAGKYNIMRAGTWKIY